MSDIIKDWGPILGFWGGVGQILLIMIMLLLTLAFILLFDRKVWAAVQIRKGPNVVGPFGLFQSFADFGKFVLKEIVIPAGANKTVFILAPLLTFVLAFAAWAAVVRGAAACARLPSSGKCATSPSVTLTSGSVAASTVCSHRA